MKLNLFVAGLIFSCVCTCETEAIYSQKCMDSGHTRETGPVKKRLRKDSENNVPHAGKQRRLYEEEVSEEISEKESIAVEQLLRLCQSEISQQGKSSDDEGKDVIEARCAFLFAVRNILLCRQSLSRTYIRAMRLGEVMSRCRRELQILENDMKIFEANQEKAKQDAVERFFQLKKAQERAKL